MVNIIKKNNETTVKFHKLKEGDSFISGGLLYIKCHANSFYQDSISRGLRMYVNAFCVTNNCPEYFNDSVEVYPREFQMVEV